MIKLDFHADRFILSFPYGALDVQMLMNEYGLDFAYGDSTSAQVVMFTQAPYAAATWYEYATPAAREKLGWVVTAVEASRALSSGRHLDVPSDRELIPFQSADCAYILDRAGALDGDEPGLGKTPTAVVVGNTIQARRICVICPASLRRQWETRIREWTTIPDVDISVVMNSKNGISYRHHYLVLSYEVARHPAILRALVRDCHFDLLIVDEAHYAKELSAARTRAIFGYFDGRDDDGESVEHVTACLMDVSDKVLLLSGTPTPNRPSEAYLALRALDHAAIDWMSLKSFRERFNPRQSGKTASGKVWSDEEQGRLPELQNRLRAHVMCRHLEVDIRHQLKAAFPDPVYDLIYLEETKAIKMALEHEKLLDIDPESFAGADFEILGRISTVRLEMGLAMAPQVANYLSVLAQGGAKKLVIFGWHKEVLELLRSQLAPFGALKIDGSDGAVSKDFKVQQFVNDPNINFLFGQIMTLGTGTDGLQHTSHHCLFAEPDWVPGNNYQCVKRLARIGQLSRVMADFFLVRDSMAEKVLATALRKEVNNFKTLDRSVRDLVIDPTDANYW